MTPKYHANKQNNRRNRSQTKSNYKISSKLINRSSISEKGKFSYKSNAYDHCPEEEKRNYEKNFVKVINTLDPSHESASVFTRKTKNP